MLATLLFGAGVVGAGGCSRSQPSDVPGTATFLLSATGASGTVYRLRSAKFNVLGPESREIVGPTDPQDTKAAITTQMLPGNYQITLEAGWQMWRIPTAGDPVAVPATLVSPDTLPFVIASEQDTKVIYGFTVAGEEMLVPGTLTVGIAVTEVDGGGSDSGAPLDPCRACEMTRCKIAQPISQRTPRTSPYDSYSVCFSSIPWPDEPSFCGSFDPTATTAERGPAAGTPKSELCQAVLACVRSSPSMCAAVNWDKCYCGTLDDAACVSGQVTPNGDCKSAIEDAAETTDPNAVAAVSGNPCGAAGAAQDVFSFCDMTCCAVECGLTTTRPPFDGDWCLAQ
jgi:hypothetical protein